MKILVTGATGLVGKAFVAAARNHGHTVVRLVRTPTEPTDIRWDASSPVPNDVAVQDVDCIVNLAGTPIASKRWTKAVRNSVYRSRIDGTKRIVEFACNQTPPPIVINASAIGIYGAAGDTMLSESAPSGTGFLATVCRDWESECEPARAAGSRVVLLRIGMVLDRNGGALAQMLPIFRLGLAGRLGSGTQFMSWISLSDLVAAIEHCIDNSQMSGPVNAVSPNPVRNSEFTAVLARRLNRPAIFTVPAFILKAVLGGLADELLLSSIRVSPNRLLESGFEFQHGELDAALENALG
jgi:uncharacterized protein (TIGR01777 family)